MKVFLIFFLLIGHLFSAEFKYPYLSDHAWRAFCNWHLTESEGFDPLNVQKRGYDSSRWQPLKKV